MFEEVNKTEEKYKGDREQTIQRRELLEKKITEQLEEEKEGEQD